MYIVPTTPSKGINDTIKITLRLCNSEVIILIQHFVDTNYNPSLWTLFEFIFLHWILKSYWLFVIFNVIYSLVLFSSRLSRPTQFWWSRAFRLLISSLRKLLNKVSQPKDIFSVLKSSWRIWLTNYHFPRRFN